MPQGPKGAGWGFRTVFGKPKYPKKGTGCDLVIALFAATAAAVTAAAWWAADTIGVV